MSDKERACNVKASHSNRMCAVDCETVGSFVKLLEVSGFSACLRSLALRVLSAAGH